MDDPRNDLVTGLVLDAVKQCNLVREIDLPSLHVQDTINGAIAYWDATGRTVAIMVYCDPGCFRLVLRHIGDAFLKAPVLNTKYYSINENQEYSHVSVDLADPDSTSAFQMALWPLFEFQELELYGELDQAGDFTRCPLCKGWDFYAVRPDVRSVPSRLAGFRSSAFYRCDSCGVEGSFVQLMDKAYARL